MPSGFTEAHLKGRIVHDTRRRAPPATTEPPPAEIPPSSPKPSKLRNQPSDYNGQRYDSKAEARRAYTLDMLQAAGQVLRWERQIDFPLAVAGVHICSYRLDFRVFWADGRITHEDVKGQKSGVPYRLFQAKQRLMLALHGIEVIEIK